MPGVNWDDHDMPPLVNPPRARRAHQSDMSCGQNGVFVLQELTEVRVSRDRAKRHGHPLPWHFVFYTQGKSSELQSNTKTRSAAVHYKQLLAVGPTLRTEKRHGDTETYKALPRKNIFRTFDVVRRNTSK